MSNKLPLDQYYTPSTVAEYCIDKTLTILEQLNREIDFYIEPSAGTGSFSTILRERNYEVLALDIEPKAEGILTADFLTYDINSVVSSEKTLIIGNPPYGDKLHLARLFFKKAITLGDCVAFILPISQLNKTQSLYEYDLVHSEDLGLVTFSSTHIVPCCLNIYCRPEHGLNKRKIQKLKDITIVRQDSKAYATAEYDIRLCYWGNASVGKILTGEDHYSAEYKIKINNDSLKADVIHMFETINWHTEYSYTAMAKLQQYQIYQAIQKYVPGVN